MACKWPLSGSALNMAGEGMLRAALRTEGAVAARPQSLLRLDPDFGNDLDPELWRSLRATALVDVESFEIGRWDPSDVVRHGRARTFALLVIDGLLLREVQVGPRAAAELFGGGDLIQPPDPDDLTDQRPASWRALIPGRVALLDDRLLASATPAMVLLATLASRSIQRGRILSALALTRTMRRTDQRLLFLLSVFAVRWGRMRGDGIRLTLPVSHEILARLIGTRRQAVTTALGELRALGLVRLLPDGDWLLAHPLSSTPPHGLEAEPEHARDGMVVLPDVDPRLAGGIASRELALARRRARARVRKLARGVWNPAGEYGNHDNWLGLLVVTGFLARRTSRGREATLEILGPGDLIRPWDDSPDWSPDMTTSWQVLVASELAELDESLCRRIAHWPSVTGELLARMSRRARWLAVLLAISQQTKLEDRLICLFLHLSARWGTHLDRLTVPIPLTHAQLGELACAERPSVSGALGKLHRRGLLQRLPDGTWRLSPDCLSLAESLWRVPGARDTSTHGQAVRRFA